MGPGDTTFICEARQFGERMHCGRCELHGIKPGDLVCKDAKDTGLYPTVIRQALDDAAVAIGASLDAASRVSIGMGKDGAPDPRLLRREAAIRAGVRFIDRYQPEKR